MALGAGLGAHQQLGEQLALALHAFVEGQFHGGLDRFDAMERRFEAALFAGDGLLVVGEQVRVFLLHVQVADLAQRGVVGHQLAGVSERAFEQITADHFVDDADLEGVLGFHRVAADDHVQGGLGADQTGQTLGAAGAGQQAQLHFRQADLGGFQGDAVVAAQRHFQAAAQGGAVDGGDHQLVAAFVFADHVRQGGPGGRLAEFTDVGAGGEGAAFADHHQGFGLVVFQALAQAVDQPFAHTLTQGVDRRIVDADNTDVAFKTVAHYLAHDSSFSGGPAVRRPEGPRRRRASRGNGSLPDASV